MKYLLLLFPILLLTSCSTDTSGDTQLTGEWQGVSWMVNEQPSNRDASQVTFEFQPDGTYSASFGTQAEAGSYRVEADKLYTHAEGQAEKMVEVALSGTDTLRMDMNRAGTPEVLVLVKR
ncbi:MAG: lipocalin family protein [Phaeodactylibacter sp.]|uniref:lipocalin family protein n=1 Tax=Phaeodactylibacter sp. TaxID=1940289 RepID=UPI0032EA9B64